LNHGPPGWLPLTLSTNTGAPIRHARENILESVIGVVAHDQSKATCYGVFSTEGWTDRGCEVGAGVVKANDGYVGSAKRADPARDGTWAPCRADLAGPR
jgi:hypothetical protein